MYLSKKKKISSDNNTPILWLTTKGLKMTASGYFSVIVALTIRIQAR